MNFIRTVQYKSLKYPGFIQKFQFFSKPCLNVNQNLIQATFDETFVVRGPPFNVPKLEGSLGTFFFHAMDKHLQNIAQIDPINDKKETYETLRLKAIRTALHLQSIHMQKDDVLMICSTNTMNAFVLLLAGLFMGCTITPIHIAFSKLEKIRIISLTRPKVLFCNQDFVPILTGCVDEAKVTTTILTFEENFKSFTQEHMRERSFQPQVVDVNTHLAYILNTSGTNGLIKGVPLTDAQIHANFFNYLPSLNKYVVLQETPLFWILTLYTFHLSILQGATRIITDPISIDTLVTYIRKYGVDTLVLLPHILHEIIRAKSFPRKEFEDKIQVVFFGGQATPSEIIDEFFECFGKSIIRDMYGSTEMGGLHVGFLNNKHDYQLAKRKIYSNGKLLPGTQAIVLDINSREPVNRNIPGELLIKGPSLTTGYYKDPEATAISFDTRGYLHTGDVVYFDEDDCLFTVGRTKEILKYKGFQIAPAEIEAEILNSPAVKQCCVVGRHGGPDGDLPCAFVVKKPGFSNVTDKDIINFVQDKLTDLQQLRGGVIFIDRIPTTASGKIKRLDLIKKL